MRILLFFNFILITGLVYSQEKMFPVFSIEINKIYFTSLQYGDSGVFGNKLKFNISGPDRLDPEKSVIHFENISNDTLEVRNIVPFGADSSHVYITGKGEHALSRTHLFIPGKIPVNTGIAGI